MQGVTVKVKPQKENANMELTSAQARDVTKALKELISFCDTGGGEAAGIA